MLLIEQDTSYQATHFRVGNKVCSICKVEKPVVEFVKSLTDRCRNGVSGRCLECNRTRNRLRYQAKGQSECGKRYKKEVMHYGIDEKYGATWGYLAMALWSMRNGT